MKTTKHQIIIFLSFCAVPFLIWIGYLLAFYPGVLSFDSVNQWDQLSQFNFSNWHPAYHTILMWLVTRIRYSPATVALFQIIVYSLVLGYGLYMFSNDFGVPYFLLILFDVVITIVPINGMMVITLWKDVLYSVFVLLLTIYVLKIISSNGNWIESGNNWAYLGVAVGNISLLRHNGFPVGFGTLIVCMFFFRRYKYFIKAVAVAMLFVLLIVGPVYKIFKVNRASSQSVGVVFVHPIAAHVNSGTSLLETEKEFLNKIYPLKEAWSYSCYDATIFFYKGVNFQPVQESTLYAAKMFYSLTTRNPLVTIDHFLCLSSFVWQVKQPNGVYLETILTSNMNVSNDENWKAYQSMVEQRSKVPVLRDFITETVNSSYANHPDSILWRPAIYFYIFIISVFAYFLKEKNKSILILLVPVLIQSSIISVTAQLQALRYQYPVYIVSLLFSLPLIYISSRKLFALKKSDLHFEQLKYPKPIQERSNTMTSISIIVPAYNEEATIERVLALLVEKVSSLGEIIVVDDGSTDRTSEIVELFSASHPIVRYIRQEKNGGKTAALRTGFSQSSGDIVIVQDADLEYDPGDIPNLVEPIISQKADVVYGSRFMVKRASRVLYFRHYMANRFLTFLLDLFTDMNFTDVETGYKAFRGEIIRNMIIEAKGFGFEIEVTAKIQKLECKVYEVPISYYGRTYKEGKKIGLSDGLMAIFYIFKYSFFCPLSKSYTKLPDLS